MSSNLNANVQLVFAFDLAPIKAKLMHVDSGEGWSREQADAAEGEYRRFLYLMKQFPHEQVAPRVSVDIFWHYHILDTMKYAADCQQLFGYFLHHVPSGNMAGEDEEAEHLRAGARMQVLYEATFGETYIRQQQGAPLNARLRPSSAKTAWCSPATAKTAWCSPATANTAWCSLAAAAKAAWCSPSTARTACPQTGASNALQYAQQGWTTARAA